MHAAGCAVRPGNAPSLSTLPKLLTCVALGLVLFSFPALSTTAAAQDDGVHVDPDSAPAKEYALPLHQARGVGQESGGGSSRSSTPAPSFGSGITPKPAASAAGSSSQSERPTRSGNEASGDKAAADSRDREVDAATTVRASNGDDGGGSGGTAVLYSIGAAVAVLIAGALVALALRRRQSTA